MSSSTDQASMKCDFSTPVNASLGELSGSRRWSRNISNHRKQELKRLNQIEKRRQLLELERQNDLFEQMSVATSEQKTFDQYTTASLTREVTQNGSPSNPMEINIPALKMDGSNTATQLEVVTSNDQQWRGVEDNNSQGREWSRVNFVSPGSRLTSEFRSPEDVAEAHDEIGVDDDYSDDDDFEGDSRSRGEFGESEARHSDIISRQTKIQNPTVKAANKLETSENLSTKQQENFMSNFLGESKTKANTTILKQQSPVKRPMSLDQVKEFVSVRVPENKRVLCLIVRDKLSRLNKAKSYFYPTYYLFIQAIADMNEQNVDSGLVTNRNHSEEDFQAVTTVASTSADNSFSASSSISADMLFIGSSSAGASGGGEQRSGAAINLSAIKHASNSYSDNDEVYADTETEEDLQRVDARGVVKTLAQTKSSDQSEMRLVNPRGRASPLVFPNGNNSNRDTIESGSPAVAEPPALGRGLSENYSSSDAVDVAVSPNARKIESSSDAKHSYTTKTVMNRLEMGRNELAVAPELLFKMKLAASDGLSVEVRNENEDELEDDSDIDESFNKSGRKAGPEVSTIASADRANCKPKETERDTNEEVDYTNTEENLFDNERNPFTGTYGVLLAGRRRKKAKTYLIGPNEHGYTRKNSICKLKSNVLGTQFNAISLKQAENKDRSTIASISYETNVLGFKGPRKMRVFLAKDSDSESFKSLPEKFKKNPDTVVQLKNMTPSWNVESQSYVLNFHGRVTQASVKNFQLIECDDHLTEGQKYDSQQVSSNQAVNRSQLGKDVSTNRRPSQHHQSTSEPQQSSTDNRQTKIIGQTVCNRFEDGRKDRSLNENNTNELEAVILSKLSKSNNKGNDNTENLDSDKSSLQMSHKSLTYNNSIVMQFGRISTHEFTCDVTHPLSILQAFAIALSSFDSKLACE